MNLDIGQAERKTQNRIIKLFIDALKYDYIGDLSENEHNSNIDVGRLEHFLFAYQEYDQDLIRRAIARGVPAPMAPRRTWIARWRPCS